MIALGALLLSVWSGLLLFRGGYWQAREREDLDEPSQPRAWPKVVAIVPARDEEEVIERSVGSLSAQDYAGEFRIIVVDDGSADATAALARRAGGDRATVLRGRSPPAGWTGKLWAMSQGVEAAEAAPLLWFTDADIEHAPDALRRLVARAEAGRYEMVSVMARLRCAAPAEKAFVPPFVYFFQLLYPFSRVNSARSAIAAAAGGCMLVRSNALRRAGGLAAIRSALIDDCALGALIKREGPIWLGLTHRSVSIRPYDSIEAIGRMVSRSAFAQLRYSWIMLAAAVIGLGLVFLGPPSLALFGSRLSRILGVSAWLLMALSLQPMLHFYGRSWAWGPALPAIAAAYLFWTLRSALEHVSGRGGMWKGRAQAALEGS